MEERDLQLGCDLRIAFAGFRCFERETRRPEIALQLTQPCPGQFERDTHRKIRELREVRHRRTNRSQNIVYPGHDRVPIL